MLIDTHAHLYLPALRDDLPGVLERARTAGVTTIVMPAIDPPSAAEALTLAEAHAGLWVMAAIHPSSVQEATEADLDAVAALLPHPRVVAVGESGLDYYWDRSFDDKQYAYLRWHVRQAIDADLPLILHNRDRADGGTSGRVLVDLLQAEKAAHPHGDRLRGIFHCFGGPPWLAEEVLALGFHVGLGGTLTYHKPTQAVAQTLPLERVVLETDSPYLAPAPHRGKRNEPAYVRLVAEKLAELRGMTLEEVATITTANAVGLFGLS